MNRKLITQLVEGKLAPWKVEEALIDSGDDRFLQAARIRRSYIEEMRGMRFSALPLLEKPLRRLHTCPKEGTILDLVAGDPDPTCPECGGPLEPSGESQALVAAYIGGVEDFYSLAGNVSVSGDVNADFVNIIQYGTGLGPMGIARGCYLLSRLGGVKVTVAPTATAARCLAFSYDTSKTRDAAWEAIESALPALRETFTGHLAPWAGRLKVVEPLRAQSGRDYRLYVTFIADFPEARGHHAVSKAVGAVKGEVETLLRDHALTPDASYIAQGYDGDLKPSPRNVRGRYTRAEVIVHPDRVESIAGISAERLHHFVGLDAQGVSKLGWFGHTGMGGEVIPACYKAAKLNPHSPLVSSMERIACTLSKNHFTFAVEMPNIEGGVRSTGEGLIPPVGREILKFIGIRHSREFAAWVATLVLAAEFNLCVEIARNRLYKP